MCLASILGGCFGAESAWGQKELHVAAAADLQPVMPVLAQAYEHLGRSEDAKRTKVRERPRDDDMHGKRA